ncbi:GNAT family N-acetyltransferase [Nocardiopsis sp. RSe5-2]|uniref:GNAT family N-acetyltransferase n=1 Tax=Nocardiopsis endophytica TaxID=3018445 RepID=A0ABT4UER6_9ACTN|nr:GNAT family N-acetyltransferase [Nocardiopsis endophytica]MDA2814842.1 GNAT family N-acetyltransferase [Nocardiopsis endophytica]
MTAVVLTPKAFGDSIDALADLLTATVAAGASVGFPAPIDTAQAAAWWRSRRPAVDDGSLQVWAAPGPGGRILGTAGLAFAPMPNGAHRAEVVKVMVHPDARGRGLGRTLLHAVEEGAAQAGVSLLVLDTEVGGPAERLYGGAGWTPVGVIPDFAADTKGELQGTRIYYKRIPAHTGPGR